MQQVRILSPRLAIAIGLDPESSYLYDEAFDRLRPPSAFGLASPMHAKLRQPSRGFDRLGGLLAAGADEAVFGYGDDDEDEQRIIGTRHHPRARLMHLTVSPPPPL